MSGGLRAGLLVSAACLLALAGQAQARSGLELGFSDPLFQDGDPQTRALWLDRSVAAGAGTTKLFASWRGLASGQPADPADPADPAYDFSRLDAAVRDARARGLSVLINVVAAPDWAEGRNRDPKAPAGTWKPRTGPLSSFMQALARRYSGSYQGLPRVRDFQLWNEPNLPEHMTPQWKGRKPVAARHYTKMLRAAYKGISDVKGSRLVGAGLAPYGDDPGGERTRPLRFWREVFCLGSRKRLKKKKRCPAKAKFDVMAHHAINTSGPPTQSAIHPDDASSADLRHVRRTLRRAEKQRTIGPRERRPLWVTEFWWESDPPSNRGYPLRKQARYIQETMYLAWRAGFSEAIQLRIRDATPNDDAGSRTGDGLYFLDGTAKPSLRAFRFPFVAERKRGRRVRLWGKAPTAGKVVIERRRGKRWKRVKKLRAGGNRVFAGRTKIGRGVRKLRAKSGGEKSFVWKLG